MSWRNDIQGTVPEQKEESFTAELYRLFGLQPLVKQSEEGDDVMEGKDKQSLFQFTEGCRVSDQAFRDIQSSNTSFVFFGKPILWNAER